ncbi:MAG: folylpolyglutamate synthase/dihydrofolate synthase family protein, partial [Nocardioides sp.]
MNDAATEPPTEQPRLAQTFAEVEDALLSRWPETRLEPSLDRIRAFTELLGDPQRAYPVIQLTGTNGKTSTSRMIDTLLRALDLRTGRFTSPHLERMNERICIDGEPLTDEEFVRAFNDVAPYTHLVDSSQPEPLSFFETVVAMAYAAFADAPVDVAVVEVGMGGTWDATNVADAQVAVVTPIGVDHASYLGESPEVIAVEKAGIIKPGSTAVLTEQLPGPAEVLLGRAEEVGASVVREGLDFSVAARVPAVGGQLLSLQGLRARYDEVLLPLYGAHQAQNAATALAAVEAFAGDRPLDEEIVRDAFARASSPGRLEVIRRSPMILLDAAHNPHGARAVADALDDSFAFSPLIGVIGVMADKDHEGVLGALEPHLAHVVCTQNSTERALPAARLAEVAREVFGA